MKAKKALKKLDKAQGLLSDVIEQFQGSTDLLGELLVSAKRDLARAKTIVDSPLSTAPVNKPIGAGVPLSKRPGANGSAGVSPGAKQRVARAKSKPPIAVTGPRPRKTT